MGPWLRLYCEVSRDPVLQLLPAETFRLYINCLCIAKERDKGGVLPPDDELAWLLRCDPTEHLRLLASKKLITEDPAGRTFPTWEARQYKSDCDPTALVRKRRQRAKGLVCSHCRTKKGLGASCTNPACPTNNNDDAHLEWVKETA